MQSKLFDARRDHARKGPGRGGGRLVVSTSTNLGAVGFVTISRFISQDDACMENDIAASVIATGICIATSIGSSEAFVLAQGDSGFMAIDFKAFSDGSCGTLVSSIHENYPGTCFSSATSLLTASFSFSAPSLSSFGSGVFTG